ncbi:acyltransferase [Pseudomonadales bacterium]|nr:acyltransferase [Pseudomonadales bacterium]
MNNWVFRENSLDMLRLFAACQVAFMHTLGYMMPEYGSNIVLRILGYFPGVPIFFFISGYLISKAFENSPNNIEYAKNRFLRLYPALIICVGINLLMVAITGYFSQVGASAADVGVLFLAKASFFQFWNPEFMRAFGDGVLNGSLWTICVELQFYMITPLLYFVIPKDKRRGNYLLVALLLLLIVCNRILVLPVVDSSNELIWKFYRVSFMPWLYMFITGILFQRNFAVLSAFVSRIPWLILLPLYCIYAFVMVNMGFETGNKISPIVFFALIFLIFRLAYLGAERSNNLLRGNDISYGIYIWHMPIVNQMLFLNYGQSYLDVVIALILTFLAAVTSWVLVEKPAIQLKHVTLNSTFSKFNSKRVKR